jgi:hypothetical protein
LQKPLWPKYQQILIHVFFINDSLKI